jgi:hypothetical protein
MPDYTKLMFERLSPVPAILLASIALQESTCNPNTVGKNGEQGLMQVTPEKCNGAPGGNCRDVVRTVPLLFLCQSCLNIIRYFQYFNIGVGADYFRTVLDANGGNALLALGNYNGWKKGMTFVSIFFRIGCSFRDVEDTFSRPKLLNMARPPTAIGNKTLTSKCSTLWI